MQRLLSLLTISCLFAAFSVAPLLAQPLSFENFEEGSGFLATTSGTAAGVTLETTDNQCQTIRFTPDGGQIPSGNGYKYNVRDSLGQFVTDLTGNLTVTIRVASAAALNLGWQFRSGGGSNGMVNSEGVRTGVERTERQTQPVPAGLGDWTIVTFDFSDQNTWGDSFAPDNISEGTLFFEPGTAGFPGDNVIIDYIAVGGAPDDDFESSCAPDGTLPLPAGFNGSTVDDPQLLSTSGSAGSASTYFLDEDCGVTKIVVNENETVGGGDAYNVLQNVGTPNNVLGRTYVIFRLYTDVPMDMGVRLRDDDRNNSRQIIVPLQGGDWETVTAVFPPSEYGPFNPRKYGRVLFYPDPTMDNFPASDFIIDWVAVGGMPDASENTTCDVNQIFPLTWSGFEGRTTPKGQVDLNWTTSQEALTSHFEVEHSTDGLNYGVVGNVAAAGNSSVARSYDFRHANAPKGTNYYRLRQVDLDGRFTYSEVVNVMLRADDNPLAYPNPAVDQVNVTSGDSRPYRIYDQSGRAIRSGVTAGQVEVSDLKPGKYYLRVDGVNHPFVKQ